MDLLNKIANQAGGSQADKPQGQQPQQSGSGGNFLDKLNGMAGGGAEGEKKEDSLDKGEFPPTSQAALTSSSPNIRLTGTDLSPGIDWVQEKVFKAGPQTDESAAEQ